MLAARTSNPGRTEALVSRDEWASSKDFASFGNIICLLHWRGVQQRRVASIVMRPCLAMRQSWEDKACFRAS